VTGTSIALRRGTARDVGYEVNRNAGSPSQKGVASTTMIFSGLILLAFLVIHILHFKYGPGERAGYVTTVDGHPARDLYRLVIEEFNKPLPTFGYVLVMLLLGLHLRHGFWSAFQSLGIGSPRLTPVIRAVGIALAVLLAIGFIAIPLYIFLGVHSPAITLGGLS
jgi:succinate dehydrogenase / fumarate reductase cytochrome b subunit